MSKLIVSVSGLRGVVGSDLTPAVVADFCAAYGSGLDGGRVIVSRDGRTTGEMVAHAAVAGLLSAGCTPVTVGVAATPTVGVLVRHLKAAGAIQVTASHNPPEWNGLKPFAADGTILGPDEATALADRFRSRDIPLADWSQIRTTESYDDPHQPHLEQVLGQIDADAVRSHCFRVVLDANHGSGSRLGRRLLEALGCEVTLLGGEPDGRFDHLPEPLRENLGGLCRAVTERGADVGFAVDPDADRLAVVDETGRYLGEENTLALVAEHVLATKKGPVVVNCSTSRAIQDLAERNGCPFYRSKVGEANVVAVMKQRRAVLGGEGNGGVIDPRVGYVRDSMIGMALILELLAQHPEPLSHVAGRLPVYVIVKDKIACTAEGVSAFYRALRGRFADATEDRTDGLRLDWPDRWLHVRPSNTEPIVRIIAEGPDEQSATALCREAREMMR